MKKHEKYMLEALKEAKKAYLLDEVPIGCVIVKDNKIIARAHNKRENKEITLAHAELLAIEKANKKLNSWRLEDCDLYVTLEPCMMCVGAIIQARIKHVYFGATDNKSGALGGSFNVLKNKFNHKLLVTKNVLKEESEIIIKDFFKQLRKWKSPSSIAIRLLIVNLVRSWLKQP